MAARMSFRLGYLIGGGAVLLGILPVILALGSAGLAGILGCTVNEAGASPCLVAGIDLGPALVFAFVSGWFALLTLPLAAGGALFLLGLGAFDLIRRLR
jgi:hypothetical protein